MARRRNPNNPPCAHCGDRRTLGHGTDKGVRRWRCHGCGCPFCSTTGTPVHRLKTPVQAVAQALLIVLRRGSLRAAEEVTGHQDETIGVWLRRAADHADALTQVLGHALHLAEGEVAEFWSFVRTKGGGVPPPVNHAPRRASAHVGAA